MITLVIVAIAVALAAPTYQTFVEKRQVSAAAEDVVSFIAQGRSLAVKRNEFVTVKWSALNANGTQSTDASHPPSWCLGLFAPSAYPDSSAIDVDDGCDCRVTAAATANSCSIDGTLYRLAQSDFVNISSEFMDFARARGHFTFDPVRGIIGDSSEDDLVDGGTIFDLHSSAESKQNGKRLFELRIRLRRTGTARICTDGSSTRVMALGGYPAC